MVVESLVANPVIDTNELAFVLFPTHIHPKRALSRLCNANSNASTRKIDEDQIKRLAVYLGVSVTDLFNGLHNWELFKKDNSIAFWKGDNFIMIELSYNTGYLFRPGEEPVSFGIATVPTMREIIEEIEN